MSQLLHAKIAAVRRKRAFVASGTGLAAALAAGVALRAGGMLLDWWLDLPRAWRLALLALDGGVALALLVGLFIVPLLRAPDDEEIALAVEAAEPTFRSRLIAAVQFARPGAVPAGASMSLVRATIAQAEQIARPAKFTRVVRTDRLGKLMVGCALLVLLCAAGYAMGGQSSRDLLARAFGSNVPVPRDTRVELLGPAYRVVAIGDDVELSAKATGVVPPAGTLRVVTASGRRQSLPMPPSPDAPGVFTRTLANVQESFTYTVGLNDGASMQRHAIEAVPRPAAVRVSADQIYPAYAARPDETRGLGDLALLNGSRLRIHVIANKPVRDAGGAVNHLHLTGVDRDLPLRPAPPRKGDEGGDDNRDRALFREFALPAGTTGFSVHLVDEHGLKSRDPPVYPIALVPDKPPKPRIIDPRSRETLAVRQQKQWVRYEVIDDFDVADVALLYRVNEGDVQRVSLKPAQRQPVVRGERLWDLSEVKAKPSDEPILEGSSIEFWIEAADANDVDGPGVGSSDHYTLRIVSEADWKAAMWTRLGDSIQSIRRTTEAQERLAGSTGSMLLDRPSSAATQPAQPEAPQQPAQPTSRPAR